MDQRRDRIFAAEPAERFDRRLPKSRVVQERRERSRGPGVADEAPLFQPFARGVTADGPAGRAVRCPRCSGRVSTGSGGHAKR